MKVTIKTAFGKVKIDMTKNDTLTLIQQVIEYAKKAEQKVKPVPDIETTEEEPPQLSAEPVTEKVQEFEANRKAEPKSRVEAMFGKKEDWNMPEKNEEPKQSTEGLKPTHTGFLYLRCEACGKERGFMPKIPISHHRCECGHSTELHDLRQARVVCKCGGNFKYKTNIRDRCFTMNCLKCGAPVDLEVNKQGGYNTVM